MNARRYGWRAAVGGGAAALMLAAALPAAAAEDGDVDHIDLSVTIPATSAGEFTWTAPTSVSLGTASLDGDRLRAESEDLVVTVSDTRGGLLPWGISGAATQFAGPGSATFSSAYLGWAPEVTVAGAGAVAGPEAASGFDPAHPGTPIDDTTRGLASTKVLAAAVAGHGDDEATEATITAPLTLLLPRGHVAGTYDAVLSLTVSLGG